jgi:hypothetical protein
MIITRELKETVLKDVERIHTLQGQEEWKDCGNEKYLPNWKTITIP